jgi:DNA-binding response OmpR family regulator
MGNMKQESVTVLLLETSSQVRETVKSMLRDSGFFVDESYDFEAALGMLKTVSFDLLLCCSAPR